MPLAPDPSLSSSSSQRKNVAATGVEAEDDHWRMVIEHGDVPLLVQLLSSGSDDGKEQVMSSSIWWHNCIEKTIVFACIYVYVGRLHNFNVSCIEQALWALGNFASDSVIASDLVLNHGAFPPLLSLLWNPLPKKKQRKI